MADSVKKGEIYLRLLGDPRFGGRVRADAFTLKLRLLIKAAKAADKSANGSKRFDYAISDLRMKSAGAVISEYHATKVRPPYSSADILGICAGAINKEQFAIARQHIGCVRFLHALAKDPPDMPCASELVVGGFEPVRVDEVFCEKASRAATLPADPDGEPAWFRGVTFGSFDGAIKEVDLRGNVSRVKLILTAGRKEIDCYSSHLSVDEIRAILDRRVRVEGYAHYDGRSGLPHRIDVTAAKPVKVGADFLRWEGAFEPFAPEEWDADI